MIIEPFAGLVFGMTPGETTKLAGMQHGGVLTGMLAVALASLLGLVHGYAHGLEWSAQTGLTAFAGGLVLATLALHGLGLLAAAAMIRLRLEGLLRLVGGGVAVSGLAGLLALAS